MNPTFIDPAHILGMARDEYEPEQFLPWRTPTVFRLRYRDQRWRRVYTEHRGVAYLSIDSVKFQLRDDTLQALYQLQAETPSYPRPVVEEDVFYPSQRYRDEEHDFTDDSDIPF